MKKNIFYITLDAERAVGLEGILENYHIISYYNNHTYRTLKSQGFSVFSIEDVYGEIEPIKKNSNAMLNDAYVQEYINEHTSDGDQIYIQVFKITPKLEKSIKDLEYKLLNTSADLNQKFEHKISQYQFLSELKVSIPKTVTGILSEIDFQTAKSNVGGSFVVQFNRGHTGTTTYFIETENDFDSLKRLFPQRAMKLSEMIKGDPWTLNCVTTHLGTFYTGLSYQITGDEKLTSSEGATVGNDWTLSTFLTPQVVKKIMKTCTEVGSRLYKEGYRGLFGLDLIISPNQDVTLIEINARQPASTGIDSQTVIDEGGIPINLLHVAEFLSGSRQEFVKFINNVLDRSFSNDELGIFLQKQNQKIADGRNYSQFYIRNKFNRKARMHFEIQSGFYHLSKVVEKMKYNVTQLPTDNYYLTTVEEGRSIKPGSEVARVQVKGSCLKDKRVKGKFDQLISIIENSYSPDKVEKLPTEVIKNIDKYFGLTIGQREVKTPYFRNVKRIRAGLRVLVGKGSPEEIIDETMIFAKLKGIELEELNEKDIRDFMQEIGIGVDCSGFVAQIYDSWLKEATGMGVGKYMKIEEDSLMRKLKYYFRPIEHLDANTLTNTRNCTKVGLNDVRPGDLIRLRGSQRGFHILLIYSVSKDNGMLRSIRYVHSSPHYAEGNGIKYGIIEIEDPKGELKNQNWLEIDERSGRNFTYEGLLKDYDDNGIRRPKFSSILK